MRKPTDQYVDVVQMMNKCTTDFIYKTLNPPFTKTLFLEIVKITTSQSSSSTAASRAGQTLERPRQIFRPQPYRHPHARSGPADVQMPPAPPANFPTIPPAPASSSAYAPPPPPPWSRWGGESSRGESSRGESSRGESSRGESSRAQEASPSSATSKKRKLDELGTFQDPVPIYPKRRTLTEPMTPERNGGSYSNGGNYTPPPEPRRQNSSTQDSPQRLSPSLAKIVIGSPSSPRAHPFQNHVLMAPRTG